MIRHLQHAAYRLHMIPRWILVGCCGLILASCGKSQDDSGSGTVSGQNKNKAMAMIATNSSPAVVQLPRSLFSTNVVDGRDPFFPESTRRSARLSGSAPPAAKPAQPPWNLLKLTGLWPSKSRPLALINRTSIAPGEVANITVMVPDGQSKPESHKLRVHCLD
jgi:hypothetical protein